MPTYEYECNACGDHFDIFQKMSDPPLKKCPKCGEKVRKVVTGFAVSFKGSGFYVNDTPRTSACAGKSCSACSGCPSTE